MKLLKKLYINNFFFYALIGVGFLYCVAFIFPALYNAASYLLLILLGFLALDILILFSAKHGIEGTRIAPEKLSNGELNPRLCPTAVTYCPFLSVNLRLSVCCEEFCSQCKMSRTE